MSFYVMHKYVAIYSHLVSLQFNSPNINMIILTLAKIT